MKRLALLLLLATALSACSDAVGSADPVVTGNGSGTISGGITVNLTLTESDGVVSGSGVISGGTSLPLTVSGTHDSPSVDLVLASPGFSSIDYIATMTDSRTIQGGLVGSGFVGESLTLRR